MKKIFLLLVLLNTYFFHASAQVVTSDPSDYTNPNQEVKIIVNLDQLDQTLEHVQLLIADADSSKDLFIWTWKPYEHPAGHPFANGIGAQPWKNSNDTLKMTKESNHIYSYTMIPTEFYGVDEAVVFTEDIHFLVKPKDGGGYGDSDRKSTDLVLEINPIVSYTKSFLDENSLVSVFPNPVSDVINVSIDIQQNKGGAFILRDITNRILIYSALPSEDTGNQFQFNTSSLKKGIYFYSINIDNKIYSGKLFKN
jgi:hypothetical protein